MARAAGRIGTRTTVAVLAGLTFFFLGGAGWSYHAKAMRQNEEVRYTLAAQDAAHALRKSGLELKRLRHLDTPVTLQLELGAFHVWLKEEDALRLAEGREAVLLAVESPRSYPQLFGSQGPRLKEVFRWPAGAAEDKVAVRVYANDAAERLTTQANAGRRTP
jgi:hypothetical protein